jgi:hypothetical protein
MEPVIATQALRQSIPTDTVPLERGRQPGKWLATVSGVGER